MTGHESATLQIEGRATRATAAAEPAILHISILDAITVLLVSSRLDDHAVFSLVLRSPNCGLHHAHNCAEGARILRRHPISVIVAEQALPDGNWRNVRSAVCFLPVTPEMIVIGADSGSSSDALAGGTHDVLSRPLREMLIPGAVVLGYLRWRRSIQQGVPARRSAVYPESAHLENPWP